MNNSLRKFAFFIGLGLLGISMYWSQDGFNFNVAGDSGYDSAALMIGYFLAISVTIMEFIFSSNYKDLNASLILFGVLAYVYSIYTNYQGILHFQGLNQNKLGAGILGFLMDAAPEPMIAWGLYESLSGDFIGNIAKALFSAPGKIQENNKQPKFQPKFQNFRNETLENPYSRPISDELIGKLGKSDKKHQDLHRVNSDSRKISRFRF